MLPPINRAMWGAALCALLCSAPLRAQPPVEPPETQRAPTTQPSQIPRVTKPVATVGPSYPTSLITRVLARHQGALDRCYAKHRPKAASASLSVVLNLSIDEVGRVKSASVTVPDTSYEPLQACITSAAKAWVFPKPRYGALEVSAPLKLSSKRAAATRVTGVTRARVGKKSP